MVEPERQQQRKHPLQTAGPEQYPGTEVGEIKEE